MSALLEVQLGAILMIAVATVVLLLVVALALRVVALVADSMIRCGGTAFARWQARTIARRGVRDYWKAKG